MANSFEEEYSKMRRKVIGAVAHDFKTPLACIIGSLEILSHSQIKPTPEKIAQLTQSALQEARKIEVLINQQLDEQI